MQGDNGNWSLECGAHSGELEKADAGITVYGLRVWPLWGRLASTREMDAEPVYTVC